MTIDLTLLKPCPFCESTNLSYFRYMIGTNYPSPRGDMFRISCDCGCRFEKCQDELFEEVEDIRSQQGIFGEEITDQDLWDRMIADWNWRLDSELRMIAERHKESLSKLAGCD